MGMLNGFTQRERPKTFPTMCSTIRGGCNRQPLLRALSKKRNAQHNKSTQTLGCKSRRSCVVTTIFRSIIVVALLAAAVVTASAQGQGIKVTLLGTGNPPPVMNRFGPSTLVEAGGQKFLFDAGRGALQRLRQVGIRWQDVGGVFLTHLHSDHVVGFPDLWLTGWLVSRRDVPLQVWGPRGTKKMMSYLEQAYDYDISIRPYGDQISPDGAVLLAEDIGEGVVYEKDGVKIT